MRTILGLIPARSGSQRVKNKNIRMLGGKPLIGYTIEAAINSKLLDRVIVTTDNIEIANIARQFGAEVPFLRPAEISQSISTELEYHIHALNWLKKNENFEPALIVNLYPTTPFRKASSIDNAIRMINDNQQAHSLRSILKCTEHPYKMWIKQGTFLEPFVHSTDINIHTLAYQQLPIIYKQNASIYITRPSTIFKFKSTIGEKVLAFEMDFFESIDINNETDWLIAEAKLAEMKQ